MGIHRKAHSEKRWGTIGALFALTTLSLIMLSDVVALIAHYFWPGGVEIIPSAGSIKLLQENRQYKMQLVHPFGWQNTEVEFESGQTANISAGGMVTVGYVEQFWDNFSYRAGDRCIEVRGRFARPIADCIAARSEEEPAPNIKWPWVGPAGYDLEIYKDPRYKWVSLKGDQSVFGNCVYWPSILNLILKDFQRAREIIRITAGGSYEGYFHQQL